MDPKIIKKTQDSLGKVIKKPPLTEHLLGKPPFRFLHDIVTEVIRTSGFLKGLYNTHEMNSKNVTAKEDKVAFLQKLVDCVSMVGGENLTVRPSKIIAGHEPDKTNQLLQAMARCVRKGMSSTEAVEAVLSGKTAKPPKSKEKSDSKQGEPKDPEEAPRERRSKHDRGAEGSERRREKSADKRQRSEKRKDGESKRSSEVAKSEEKEERRRQRSRKNQEAAEKEDTVPQNEDAARGNAREETPNSREATDGADQSTPTRAQRPASAKGQRRRPHGGRDAIPADGQADSPEEPPQTQPKKLVRPPSARPAAPRVKRRDPADEELARIDSGGKHRTAPIIVDNGLSSTPSDDEDDQFLVEEANDAMDQFEVKDRDTVDHQDEDGDSEHGGLVRKILETKKELEHSAGGKQVKHTEIQRNNVASAQQQKERQLVVKEIDRLRESVQKLCQSATPLAKIIDYIQEDMDAMQNELQTWKKENKEHAMRLKDEESVSLRATEPLKIELEEAEQEIVSYRNQMAATKANIQRNQDKINKMITAVATRS